MKQYNYIYVDVCKIAMKRTTLLFLNIINQ